ncbi:MAG: hypothetical protein WHS44_01070 [Fimbriimonadales bacterium]|nr:MAG: hypothetical protein KatS3mg018_0732 [Fimbriimonadales bacterium]
MQQERNDPLFEQAVAHMAATGTATDSESPSANGSAEVAAESPARLTPATPQAERSFALSPLIQPYSDAAPFWHMPLEPGAFHDTPLLVHSQLSDAERTVLHMESYLRNAGYEVEASELLMRYTQWVKIPATQYEQLRHELEPQRIECQRQIRAADEALERAQTEFMQAMATAKIPLPLPPAPKKRTKQPPAPEPISPNLVERALQADSAHKDEVCGEQGVAQVSSQESRWTTVGQWLLEFFAPLAAGLLLGVNLGVITGLLSLEVLQRGEALWLVAMAAVIGLFVEKLVGNTAHSLMASAATASEKRDAIEVAEPFPTMRSGWRVAFFLLVITVLTVAIATVDALGLHMLYEERQLEAQLTGGGGSTEVPLWVFFIAGLIISAPYIVYKAVKGWREPEVRQRDARIAYLHRRHGEKRREEPAVQQAFAKAQEVANLRQRRETLIAELEHIEQRLDAARTECIGSTQKFCAYWDELMGWLRKERAPYAHAPQYAPRRRASGETLLQKLMGLFRR